MISGPTSHHFYSQRLKLHYVEWGNPDAPPLLLVHGGRDHCRSWDWVAKELSKDWHVIAPDMRGHGNSAWSADGHYAPMACVYDLAQLIHQKKLAPVTIVSHSYGGNIAIRYTGLYPDNVRKLVAIEGLGLSPDDVKKHLETPVDERIRNWVDQKRTAAGRTPKRYADLESATARMKEANAFLSDEQARHLTIHGIAQNEDGTYTWRYDPHFWVWPPYDLADDDIRHLWTQITCPTLLLYGADSWASNPAEDGRSAYFSTAEVKLYQDAGHWLHHDQFDLFMSDLKSFL